MSKEIWVILEAEGKKISRHSAALLEEAGRHARAVDGRLHALYVGAPLENLVPELAGRGAQHVHLCVDERLGQYQPGPYEQAALALLGEARPCLLLGLASSSGSDLLPRLAYKLGAPLVSNCVDLEFQGDGELVFLKPVQKGRLHARVRCTVPGPRLATLLPESLTLSEKPPGTPPTPEVTQIEAPAPDPAAALALVGFKKADPRSIDIGEAETIVAVGRGIGSKEHFELIATFADRVGGAIAGTRPTVDLGILPHARQIGQTGKRVSPKLLFLFGISGAPEFTKGIESAGTSVAINSDRQAPIFKNVDLGIVGDLFKLAPKILEHVGAPPASSSEP